MHFREEKKKKEHYIKQKSITLFLQRDYREQRNKEVENILQATNNQK